MDIIAQPTDITALGLDDLVEELELRVAAVVHVAMAFFQGLAQHGALAVLALASATLEALMA